MLDRVETLLNGKFVVDQNHFVQTRAHASEVIQKLENLKQNGQLGSKLTRRLAARKRTLQRQDGNRPLLRDILNHELLRQSNPETILQVVAKSIIDSHNNDMSAEELAERVLLPYLQLGAEDSV